MSRTEDMLSESSRSWLFVPASRLELLPKAVSSGADAIILDLEDAVSADQKSAARVALKDVTRQNTPLYVRINGMNSGHFAADLSALPLPHIAGIMLPKLEMHEQLQKLAKALPSSLSIVGLVETARGMVNLPQFASHPALKQIAFGSIDYALDLGCNAESFTLKMARSQVVAVSRAAGIAAPIDGVTVSTDPTVVHADAMEAKANGFGGKLCIHPKQVAPCNLAFAPTPGEIDWAQKIIAASTRAAGGAFLVDGEMVDKPVVERAKRLLAMARI